MKIRFSRKTRCLQAGAMAVAGVAVVAACTAESSGGGGETGGTLVIAAGQEAPPSLDYSQVLAMPRTVGMNVLEPLVEYDGEGGYEPLLAESWEVSDDGLTYTFVLREAVFHNGAEVTADDVVYSLEWIQNSPLTQRTADWVALENVAKVDDRTVTVTLERPYRGVLNALSGPSGYIIPQGSGETIVNDGPVGTGPFRYESLSAAGQLVLSRFDDYWGDLPEIDEVIENYVGDNQAALNQLQAGDADVFFEPIGLDRAQIESLGDSFQIASAPGPQIQRMSLSANDSTFDDDRVRQAIAHAIDRDALVEGLADYNLAHPTCALTTEGQAEFRDYCPYPYDLDRARSLLADAGATGLQVEFLYPSAFAYPLMAEILGQQLEAAGLTVDLQGLEAGAWIERTLTAENPQFQITISGGLGRVEQYVCPGGWVRDCVEEIDSALDSAATTTDQEEYVQLRQQAIELHADRAYTIPLGSATDAWIGRAGLAGVSLEVATHVDAWSWVDLRAAHWEG